VGFFCALNSAFTRYCSIID